LLVWFPVNILPFVAVSLPPPPLPVSEETGSPSDDVQPNHSGVPELSPHRIFGYRDYKRRLVFLSSLMSQGKFSIVFLSKYNTKNLVRMLLLLSEFSPSDLGLDVGHALQLSKILSFFVFFSKNFKRETFLVLSRQVPLSCTLTKTLLAVAYTQKPFAS